MTLFSLLPRPKAPERRARLLTDTVHPQPRRLPARQRARVRTRIVLFCSILDSSRLSLALARDVTIKKSASTTTRRTRDVPWAPTPRRCASMQRLISARKGQPAPRLTTGSNLSTTRRSTRPSSARRAQRKAVTLAICALLRIARTNSQLTSSTAWSKMTTSTCSTSRLSGVRSTTRYAATSAMSASTRTTGKITGASRTCTSTRPRSSAASGALRRKPRTTVTDTT